MARHSEVVYYPSKRAYMTTFRGVRYKLRACDACDKPSGPNYLAALAAFRQILEGASTRIGSLDTAGEVVLAWLENHPSTNRKTLGALRSLLSGFIERAGRVPVLQLDNRCVFSWLDRQRGWNSCTRAHAIDAVKAPFAWATREQLIPSNPLAALRKRKSDKYRARGSEFLIDAALADVLLASATGRFRDVLVALASTGARPIELLSAESFHLREAPPSILYLADAKRGYIHKTAKSRQYGDRNRTIYLTPEVAAIARRNRQSNDWLFPHESGKRYLYSTLYQKWERFKQTPAIRDWMRAHNADPENLVLYSWRHTWITNALKRGTPPAIVASLTGTSILMIERHYGHVSADKDAMLNHFLNAQ